MSKCDCDTCVEAREYESEIEQLQAELDFLKKQRDAQYEIFGDSIKRLQAERNTILEIIAYAIGGLEVLRQNDGFMDIDTIIKQLEKANDVPNNILERKEQ